MDNLNVFVLFIYKYICHSKHVPIYNRIYGRKVYEVHCGNKYDIKSISNCNDRNRRTTEVFTEVAVLVEEDFRYSEMIIWCMYYHALQEMMHVISSK